MSDTAPVPPPRLANGISRVRNALNVVARSATPPNAALFEKAQGAWRPARTMIGSREHREDLLSTAQTGKMLVEKQCGATSFEDPDGKSGCAGGRGRISAGHANLLLDSGFRQNRLVPTAGPASPVEALPV